MICAYILKCKNDFYYIGSTSNFERRIQEHTTGKSKYTKNLLPIIVLYKKEFKTLKEARSFEAFIKRQRNKTFYQKLINGAFV